MAGEDRLAEMERRLSVLEEERDRARRSGKNWRLASCAVLIFACLLTAVPGGAAGRSVAQRLAALEKKLATFTVEGRDVVLTGSNLILRNGAGRTNSANGTGNLILGYGEARSDEPNLRTGSHNLVIGTLHNYTSWGGIAAGTRNTISGPFASALGQLNEASGICAIVNGGEGNKATETSATVTGGVFNKATALNATVTGGSSNIASGENSVVTGGAENLAVGALSVVGGGSVNQATGLYSVVSGGFLCSAQGTSATLGGGSLCTVTGNQTWTAGTGATAGDTLHIRRLVAP